MTSKINTKDELLRYLLYERYGSDEICVGIKGDIDIRDIMSESLKKRIKRLLKGQYN